MSVSTIAQIRVTSGRLRVPAALGGIVGGVAVLHALLALRSRGAWIVPDELRYAELAKSLAEVSLPGIRDNVTFGFGLGCPALQPVPRETVFRCMRGTAG